MRFVALFVPAIGLISLSTMCVAHSAAKIASQKPSRSQTNTALLKQVAAIDLPGPGGKRFDYLDVDEQNHRLFSNHLAAEQTYVIDLNTNTVTAVIKDVPGAEGVLAIPELNKAYTADWYENKVGVIDLQQMKVVKRIPTESKPDGIAYAPPFHKIYVSDELGKTEAVIDVTNDEPVKKLKFDSETGMPQYDPIGRKVYVNLQDDNVLAEIDPASDVVIAKYPVGKCRGNHGMALDPEHRRAFLSCEDNDLMTVFDLDKHQSIAYLPMAAGPDVIKFDPGLGRIYVACSSGAVSVFKQEGPNRYRKLGDFPVQKKVHSLAVDTRTHRVYTPEQEENGRPVAKMIVYDAVQ